MRTEVLEEAERELFEAVEYYEQIEPGLGLRLRDETRRAIKWIADNPLLPRLRPRGYRRVNLRVFPYYIAYIIADDRIWILAVAQSHRRPEYWAQRKKKSR